MLAFSVLTRFTAKDEQSKAIKTIGKAAGGAAIAIAAISVASIKMAADFDTGLRKTSTIMDTTQMSFEQMRKGIMETSNETGRAVNLLTEAQYQAISAGVDTANSIKFVNVAVKAAIGGFTEEATAVDGLTSVLNAYGMKSTEVTKISDQMIATQNFGKTTFGELATSIGSVIPSSSALNVSTVELFSGLAAMTKQGINTTEAATKMNAVLNAFLKPSDGALKAAKKMGIEFSASAIKSKGFTAIMGEIGEKTKGNETALAKLFPNVRALSGALVITGKGAKNYAEGLDLIAGSTGATQRAFEQMNGPQMKFNKAWNKLKNVGIELGTIMLPIAEKVANVALKVMEGFDGLSDSTKNTILIVGGLITVLGGVSMAVAPVLLTITTLTPAVLALKTAWIGLNLAFMTSPFFWIPAAVAGFYLLQKRLGGIMPTLVILGETVIQTLLTPINLVVTAMTGLIHLMSISANALGMDNLGDNLALAADKITQIQDQANLSMTGTTNIIPGSRLIEAVIEGDPDKQKSGLGTQLADLGSGSKSSLDLNINNNTGFEASTSGATTPDVALTLNNGSGGSW